MFGSCSRRPSRRYAPERGFRQTPDIIWCSASISPSVRHALIARPGAGDDADVTPPRLRPSWPAPGSSPCRRPSRPPRSRTSRRREPRSSSLALSSPRPSSRTPSLARRTTPALTSDSTVDGLVGVDQLGVDRVLQPVEIDLGEVEPEDVVEAALRQAPMQRHLAAFEALDAHARTRGLALAAAARRSCPCPNRCRGRRACASCASRHCRRYR